MSFRGNLSIGKQDRSLAPGTKSTLTGERNFAPESKTKGFPRKTPRVLVRRLKKPLRNTCHETHRPFKNTAARYNTFNSTSVQNGAQAYNGISLEYYSSHNTYNNCSVSNNGAGTGTGTGNAGIITFGNFNQYNSFNNCTVSGNGNVQFYISGYDALRLAQDSRNTISGGTFTGSNSSEAVILVEGDGAYITGATINGPGPQGIYLDTQATNACVNNNTFTSGTSLGSAISANSTGDMGLGNILNLLSSNLSLGVCAPPLP